MPRLAAARFVALVAVAIVASSCDGLTGKKDGTFTLGLSDAALTVNQGKTDTVLITVTRTDYDKAITLSVEGAPTGVSTSLSPSTLSGLNQSLLIITPAGTATLGASTITVKANGEGVAEQSGTVALTVGVTGSFGMGSFGSPAKAAAASGGGALVTVFVARSGGHADNVALSVGSTPTGVAATVSPPETNGRSATLTIATDATAVPGSYTIYVKGTAQGLNPDSTAVTLNVIAPPATTSFTLPFCSDAVPVWLAYQNEGYPWVRVTPTGSSFIFNATEKLGIAYTSVLANPSSTVLEIYYADRSEHGGKTDIDCLGTKSVTGSIANATSGQSARVVMGNAIAQPTAASTNFTLAGIPDRALDLVAVKGTISSLAGSTTASIDKMIIRRGLNPAANSALPVLDFGAGEAFAPATTQLTVANQSTGDLTNVVNSLWSATSSYGLLHASQPTAMPIALLSVPGAQLAGADMHELIVESYQSSFSTYRLTANYLGALADRTETMPALVSVPLYTIITTSPVRLRGQLPSQADYPTAGQFVYCTGNTNCERIIYVAATAMYLGGVPTTWDITIPDLTGVSGFSANWMLSTGQTYLEADGFAGRGALLFGGVPTIGDVLKYGLRSDFGNVSLNAAGPSASGPRLPLARRGGLRASQYLRR